MSVLRIALCFVLLSSTLLSGAAAQTNTTISSPTAAQLPAGQWDTGQPMDDRWHFGLTPYLWFAGMHGTTGVLGYYTNVSASPGDLLSHFNMGLMATTDVRRNHFVTRTDAMWIRLTDNHGLPENPVGFTSIDFRASQFLLTPMAGYRLVDKWNLKVDALAGIRYWHLGEGLKFIPPVRNGVSTSQNWVDGVGGARFRMFVTPKLSMTIIGDAGGGAALPDYEVAGLVGWKMKHSVFQAGWRYLDVHYRNGNNQFLYDVTSAGAVIGATFTFK